MQKTGENRTQVNFPPTSSKTQNQKIRVKLILKNQISLNVQDRTQIFYKIYERCFESQVSLKHGYKLFKYTHQQEDLVKYCLSLLQFSSTFPIKIIHIKRRAESPNQCEYQTEAWAETQFMLTNETQGSGYKANQINLQQKIFDFFTNCLCKLVSQFKQHKINWSFMATTQYCDTNVIQQFNEYVIKHANMKFKQLCFDH